MLFWKWYKNKKLFCDLICFFFQTRKILIAFECVLFLCPLSLFFSSWNDVNTDLKVKRRSQFLVFFFFFFWLSTRLVHLKLGSTSYCTHPQCRHSSLNPWRVVVKFDVILFVFSEGKYAIHFFSIKSPANKFDYVEVKCF